MNKTLLESQIGIFNPDEIPVAERIMQGSSESLNLPEGIRNKGTLADGGKSSVVSVGKDSAVSIPDEIKIKQELDQLAESEEEDELFLSKIEFA